MELNKSVVIKEVKAPFLSQTELIGHLYSMFAGEDEALAKEIDVYLANHRPWIDFKNSIQKGDALYFFIDEAGNRGYCISRKAVVSALFISLYV